MYVHAHSREEEREEGRTERWGGKVGGRRVRGRKEDEKKQKKEKRKKEKNDPNSDQRGGKNRSCAGLALPSSFHTMYF